mmetsp:Transcript_12513/g.31671  ORF Transcript_12513/g.31671 Transcript_12513/m.31671 type:complete len:85 (+) Transcript_12513:514-768(+)
MPPTAGKVSSQKQSTRAEPSTFFLSSFSIQHLSSLPRGRASTMADHLRDLRPLTPFAILQGSDEKPQVQARRGPKYFGKLNKLL